MAPKKKDGAKGKDKGGGDGEEKLTRIAIVSKEKVRH